jgi:hypothetical protein
VANWAWPHTPDSAMARVMLADGPADGEQIGFLPPDTTAPAQIVWSGWFPGHGFTAYIYQWYGEATKDRGRTDALVYRCTGRRIPPDDIPPVISEAADLWAAAPAVWAEALAMIDVPREVIWPGV